MDVNEPLQAKYLSARQVIGVAQEKRYQRYAAALTRREGPSGTTRT